eukprot:333160_1
MAQFLMSLLMTVAATIINSHRIQSNQYEWLAYPTCPNIDCRISIFEFCKAASIGQLFDEYLQSLEFVYYAKSQSSNTQLKVALVADTESIFCSGLQIRRHLLSLMNTQNIEKTGVAIDLISLLEKTELHKAIHKYSFWPLSYHMDIKTQRREFFESLPCNEKLNEPWIFKNNKHKGKGIVFLDDTETIRKLFITDDDLKYAFRHCDNTKPGKRLSTQKIEQLGFAKDDIDTIEHIIKGDNYIAQKYISNTLLIDGHKFGIRMFIVILSLNPFIVLYSDGYILINAEIYDADDINKLNVLSNREISENNKDFDEEWNLSYEQFADYLKSQKLAVDFDIIHVRNKLVNAANLTFQSIIKENGKYSKSTRKKLDHYLPIAFSKNLIDKKDNNYMWLAIDFLLTMDGNVKLLEINLHPGTKYLNHCSWFNVNETSYNDWQCEQGRNITKEIVNVTFEMAFRKMNHKSWNKQMLQDKLTFHKVLIYRDF